MRRTESRISEKSSPRAKVTPSMPVPGLMSFTAVSSWRLAPSLAGVGELFHAPRERAGVARRLHLGVVVEIDVDGSAGAFGGRSRDDAPGVGRLAAGRPGGDPRRPAIELGGLVAAGVELFRAV